MNSRKRPAKRAPVRKAPQGSSVGHGRTRTNGIERLAGGWSEEDLRQFERATACFEKIDDAICR